jgi:hypothetical protein
MVSEVSVQGWMVPLLLDCGEAEPCLLEAEGVGKGVEKEMERRS